MNDCTQKQQKSHRIWKATERNPLLNVCCSMMIVVCSQSSWIDSPAINSFHLICWPMWKEWESARKGNFQGGIYGDSYRSTPEFLSQLHQKFPFHRVKSIGWLKAALLFDDTITGAIRTAALKNWRLIYIPIGQSIRIVRGSAERTLHFVNIRFNANLCAT